MQVAAQFFLYKIIMNNQDYLILMPLTVFTERTNNVGKRSDIIQTNMVAMHIKKTCQLSIETGATDT